MTKITTVEQLADLSGVWTEINRKILNLAQIGAFARLDTYRYGVNRVVSYQVTDAGKTLTVNLELYESGYGTSMETFKCPIELFFLGEIEAHAWIIERDKKIKQEQEAAVAAQKRKDRYEQYQKLKAEFESECEQESNHE